MMQVAGGRAIFPSLSVADNIRLGIYDKGPSTKGAGA